MNFLNFDWQNILMSLPGILLGLTIHEFCHALAAFKLGDKTARDQGRLTFNPLKHIDVFGFLFIIIAGFGWAKPVQFNPENLKSYRRDKAIIAAAGPLSNLLLALLLMMIIKFWIGMIMSAAAWDRLPFLYSDGFIYFILVVLQAAIINIGLFIFNLLPLPPLDGSHIFLSGLNLNPETENRIMKIGAPLLFIIILIQNYSKVTILPIRPAVIFILELVIPEISLLFTL